MNSTHMGSQHLQLSHNAGSAPHFYMKLSHHKLGIDIKKQYIVSFQIPIFGNYGFDAEGISRDLPVRLELFLYFVFSYHASIVDEV